MMLKGMRNVPIFVVQKCLLLFYNYINLFTLQFRVYRNDICCLSVYERMRFQVFHLSQVLQL